MEVQLRLNFEADKEEVFWEQHARVNWLQNDDRNTSFFHKVVVSHYNCNWIVGLEDKNVQWVSLTNEMLKIVSKFLGDLYTASDCGGDDRLLSLVEQRITKSMNDELLKPFT
ncbi:hypothetical protein J1N35_027474 [Gossypium stocksii]|uniref:Uncharacterized protein n=1 Tax=Gossypium stocksii TaxID=47602 RepID=A0A9D3VBW9_9ROSI|nr:hypothetical protein J1N35_027474 [Gossypium stocksii]